MMMVMICNDFESQKKFNLEQKMFLWSFSVFIVVEQQKWTELTKMTEF